MRMALTSSLRLIIQCTSLWTGWIRSKLSFSTLRSILSQTKKVCTAFRMGTLWSSNYLHKARKQMSCRLSSLMRTKLLANWPFLFSSWFQWLSVKSWQWFSDPFLWFRSWRICRLRTSRCQWTCCSHSKSWLISCLSTTSNRLSISMQALPRYGHIHQSSNG